MAQDGIFSMDRSFFNGFIALFAKNRLHMKGFPTREMPRAITPPARE